MKKLDHHNKLINNYSKSNLIKEICAIKLILSIVVMFQFSSGMAQYESTLNPGKSWTVSTFHYFNQRVTDSLYVNGVMELDGYQYTVLNCESIVFNGTMALMREDTTEGKVWVRYYNPNYPAFDLDPYYNKEYLLADYSLNIGDTLTYTVIADVQYNPFELSVLLTVIDTGSVAGRHYVELNSTTDSILDFLQTYSFSSFMFDLHYVVQNIPLRFYEGLGTSHSPIYPLAGYEVYPSDPFVTCVYQNGDQIWMDPLINTCNLPPEWYPTGLTNETPYPDVEISPNPSSGIFNLDLNDEMINNDYQLNIYSSIGVIINHKTQNLNNKNLSIDLSKHPQGVYYLHFHSLKNTFVFKIIKIN